MAASNINVVAVAIMMLLLMFQCLVVSSNGVSFATLQKTLIVEASPQPGQVLKGGESNITVTWSFNTSFAAGTDSAYKTVKLKLCYAPVSQKNRGWRKTEDHLSKDRTCQHDIVTKPYTPSNNTVTWTVQKDIPTATYFVRAYAYDSHDKVVAFGQTTDSLKSTNLFDILAVTGRHLSLDIASICFSVFSIVSLIAFFVMEKRSAKTK